MEFDLEHPLRLTSQDLQPDSFSSLFNRESEHMPQNYDASDFDVSIRQETISLIIHFSQNFDSFLSYLAINYLDRFISNHPIQEGKPWILKLLAVSCVSLALKMRKAEFSVTDMQNHGGLIFDKQIIRRMEFLILGALKWRMRSITPFSFINFFISFFKFKDPPLLQALKARATEIIFKVQHDLKILESKPSIIAASALLSASHELFPLQFPSFKKAISTCSYVNKVSFLNCYNVMQEAAMDEYEWVLDTVSSSNTPANVLDQQWSSLSSSDSGKTSATTDTGGVKRRKVSSFRSDDTFQFSQIQHC